MRRPLISALLSLVVAGAATTAAQASYKGPHPVMQYNGGKSLVVYRAVGSLWQRIGGTLVSKGQTTSNGSLTQNVWFKGHQITTVRGDLRRPFYRLYNNQGAIDY